MNIETFELSFIYFIQSFGGPAGSPWYEFVKYLNLFFTFLGEETCVFIIILIIYWSINKRLGEALGFTLMGSAFINVGLKNIFQRPRPFMSDGAGHYIYYNGFLVNTARLSGSYSFPSGHSQSAGALYFLIARAVRKRWVWLICSAIILAVMFSRVYLGVHYGSDVVAGAALGIGSAILLNYLFNRYYEAREVLYLIMFTAGSLMLLIIGGHGIYKTIGTMLGFMSGVMLESKLVKFDTETLIWKKIIRAAAGIGIIFGLQAGLKALFPAGEIFELLRYALIMFSAAFLYPLVFKKFNL